MSPIQPMSVLMTSTSYPLHVEDWRGRFIAEWMIPELERGFGDVASIISDYTVDV